MPLLQHMAKWVLLWVLITQPALALPGPEVLAPIGAGLLQIVALLVGAVNPRRAWRKRRRIWRKTKRVAKVLLPILVAVLYVRHFSIVTLWKAELRPERLPQLPDDIGSAVVAPPMPSAKIDALRQGGKVVVYLGEPDDYLSSQLPVGGYVLRLADWEIRQEELKAHSSQLLYIHQSFVPLPEGLESVAIASAVPRLYSYRPPLSSVLAPIFPKAWLSLDAPTSPELFSYGIPNIRAVDVDEQPTKLHLRQMSTRDFQALSDAPRVLYSSYYRQAASALTMLDAHGLTPAAFTLERVEPIPRRVVVGPIAIVLMLIAAGGLTLAAERFGRRLRTRRIAARMRRGAGPSHAIDALWTFSSLMVPLVLCGLTPFIGLSPELWRWNSPPAYNVGTWTSPLLLMVASGLWWYRSAGLPMLQRKLSNMIGVVGLVVLVFSGQVYLGHLAFPLVLFVACMVGCLLAPTKGQGWSLLSKPGKGAGTKATDLAFRIGNTHFIAEGVLIWPKDCQDPAGRIASEIGPGPYILRSTALNESDSFGTYRSVVTESDGVGEGLQAVVESYGENPGEAVLCMPFITSAYSSVSRVGLSGIHTEVGQGHDGITSGRAAIGHAYWHRHSRREKEHPNFGLMNELKRWESDEDLLVESVGSWIVQCTHAPAEDGWFGSAWRCLTRHDLEPAKLTRTGEESLDSPCGEKTLEFWQAQWGRDRAFGEAMALLGIPRFLVPNHVVLGIGGALYAHGGQWQIAESLLWFRSQFPGWSAQRKLTAIWSSVQVGNIDQLVRDSIALRLLQPFLSEDDPKLPPAPSTLFQAAPEHFPHRSAHDLDLGSARLGAGVGPAQPLAPVPAVPGQQACAYLRDWVHDGICRHIARLQQEDPAWLCQEVEDTRPWQSVTLEDLENRSGAWTGVSFWVGEPQEIHGQISKEAGPGKILYVDTPRPDLMQKGFDAIVCRNGGRYSHAALVCGQNGLSALFGTGQEFREGDRVTLTLSGEVIQAPLCDAEGSEVL